MDFVNNAIEAVGTLSAGKTISLVGAMSAMRERVDGARTSGAVTVTVVTSIIVGAFALGGIVWMIANQDKKIDTLVSEMGEAITNSRSEQTAQIDAIMESNNANTMMLVDSLKDQMAMSQKYVASELKQRDIKLDIAYASANKGPRYTAAMADEHEDEDNLRYYELKEKVVDLQHHCENTRKRVDAIEGQHDGVGYHKSSNGT